MSFVQIAPSEEIIKYGEVITSQELEHLKQRVRGFILASRAAAERSGNRRLQVQALDALLALRAL